MLPFQALAVLLWIVPLFVLGRLAIHFALDFAWPFVRRRIAESIDLCFILADCLCDRL